MTLDPAGYGTDFEISLQALDFVKSPQGGLSTLSGPDNVDRAILKLLDTPLGDLFAHPEWGNGCWDLLSEPMSAGWADSVRAALWTCLKLEPRITVQSIRLQIDPPQGVLNAWITYSLLNVPGPRDLVWTVNLAGVMASF